MTTFRGGSVVLGAALSLFALTASPAFASGPHGGGGGGGGGAGGGAHFSGGGAHSFAAGGHFGGAHFAPAMNRGGYGYAHASPGVGRAVAGGYGRVGTGYAVGGRGGYGYGRGGYYGGRWGGGYWHGGYWPPVFWGAGFAWFLPVIPAFCATYYWNSIPYYYYNDVYYTYDPSASGYVVTTPPPAQDAAPADAPNASAQDPNDSNSAPIPSGVPANSGGLYAYPKSGQSDEQQSTDRQECARWASGQTGADGNGTSIDYQRALTACLQGRGYSVD